MKINSQPHNSTNGGDYGIYFYFLKWIGIVLCLFFFTLLSTQMSAQSPVFFEHGENRVIDFGETVSIPLIANNVSDIQSIQFNLHFNPHVVAFQELNSLDTTSGILPENIGLSETGEGRIFFVALAGSEPISLNDGDTLCNIVLEAIGTPGQTSLFGVQGYPLELQAFDGSEFLPFDSSGIFLRVATPNEPDFTYSVCPNPDSSDFSDLGIRFFGDSISHPFELVEFQSNDTVFSGFLNPDSTQIISNLPEGPYRAILFSPRDSSRQIDSLFVNQKEYLDPLIVAEAASCPQIPDGNISIPFIQGGNAPYTIVWPDSTLHFRNFENLLPEEYLVNIIDEDNCSFELSIEIEGPEAIVQESIEAASCETSEDGNLNVNVLNLDRFEDSTLLFSLTGTNWFRSERLQVISVPAGPFNYFIQDTAGCIYSKETLIPFENNIQLENENQIDPRCFGTEDGLVSATARLDIVRQGDYIFDWSGPNPTVTDSFFLAVGLRPDTFELTVSHTALPPACRDTQIFILEEKDALEFDVIAKNESCFGANDGSISIVPNGGVQPYSYQWSDGAKDSTRNPLSPGNYEIELLDANLCSQTQSIKLDTGLRISWQNLDVRNLDCFQNETGQVSFQIDSSFQPGVSLSYGLFPRDSIGLDTLFEEIDGLAAGSYLLRIFASNGCRIDTNLNISEPSPLGIDTLFIRNSDCNSANGSASVEPIGGNGGPYQVEWSNGQLGSILDSVLNGTYTALVSDTLGCQDTFNIFIPSPPSPMIDTFELQKPICPGDSSGQIQLVFDTASNYSFLWSSGDTSYTLESVSAGVYTVTISTVRNCKDTIAVTLDGPDSIRVQFETEPETDGQSNGLAKARVLGGTAPFEFFWNTSPIQTDSVATNLEAGLYEVLVIDSNNCRITDTVRIDMTTQRRYPFLQSDVQLWPNPSSGMINIDFNPRYSSERPIAISIRNNIGQELKRIPWPNRQKRISSWLSGSGLYYIHVLYENGNKKVIPVIVQQ